MNDASLPAPRGERGRGVGSPPRVITIDGPASAGKTTVAEALAEQIGYHIYDTGALYRAATLLAVRAGISDITPAHEAEIVALIRNAQIVVAPPKDAVSEPTVTVNGEDVTGELRGPTVNGLVSPVSQLPGVRAALMEVQRAAAAAGGVIMVGRDMGTVVVPDAPLKLFLTADPRVRAERRTRQLAERGVPRPFDEVLREETERDRLDSGRTVAPLRPAPDAVTITTDDLTVPEIVEQAVAEVRRVAGGEPHPPAPSPRSGEGENPGEIRARQERPDAHTNSLPLHSVERGQGGEVPQRFAKSTPPSLNRFEGIQDTWWYHRVFRFTCGLVRLIVMRFARVTIHGAENMPKSGPVIVASNHLHNADPTVVAFSIPRDIHYMGKKELWKSRFFGALIEFYATFPIDRGSADRAALRYAEHVLKRGWVLGMFPEGTRSSSGKIEQVLPGAAFVAIRTGAPILPVAITGTQTLPLDAKSAQSGRKRRGRGHVTVTIGKPFHLTTEPGRKLDAATATDEIMRHIAAMLPPTTGVSTGTHPARPTGRRVGAWGRRNERRRNLPGRDDRDGNDPASRPRPRGGHHRRERRKRPRSRRPDRRVGRGSISRCRRVSSPAWRRPCHPRFARGSEERSVRRPRY